jgi:hypothetical protein
MKKSYLTKKDYVRLSGIARAAFCGDSPESEDHYQDVCDGIRQIIDFLKEITEKEDKL